MAAEILVGGWSRHKRLHSEDPYAMLGSGELVYRCIVDMMRSLVLKRPLGMSNVMLKIQRDLRGPAANQLRDDGARPGSVHLNVCQSAGLSPTLALSRFICESRHESGVPSDQSEHHSVPQDVW